MRTDEAVQSAARQTLPSPSSTRAQLGQKLEAMKADMAAWDALSRSTSLLDG